MVLEGDKLKSDKSGTYSMFTYEVEDHQAIFDSIQLNLNVTHSLPEFAVKITNWEEWIKPKMEKQTVRF